MTQINGFYANKKLWTFLSNTLRGMRIYTNKKLYQRFKNLKCIVSLGSGIDHILCDPDLPKNIPIIKTTGEDLKIRMREYVVLHVLKHHRNLPAVTEARNTNQWKHYAFTFNKNENRYLLYENNILLKNKVDSYIDLYNLGLELFNKEEYKKSIQKLSIAIDQMLIMNIISI